MVESLMMKIRRDTSCFKPIKQHVDNIMKSTSLERITTMDVVYSDTTTRLLKISTTNMSIKDFIPCLDATDNFVITRDTSTYIDEHDSGSVVVDGNLINDLNYLTQLRNEGDYDTKEELRGSSSPNILDSCKDNNYLISIHGNQVKISVYYGVSYVFTRRNSNKYSLSIRGYNSYDALNYYYNKCNLYFSCPYTKPRYGDTPLYVVGCNVEDVYKVRESINVDNEE